MSRKEHDEKASVMEKYCSLKSALKSLSLCLFFQIDFMDFRPLVKSRSDMSLKLFLRGYLCV